MVREYKPSDVVPKSGLYDVRHDPAHRQPHQLTCIEGKKFPPCGVCKHPTYTLAIAAKHLKPGESL